MKQLLVTFVLLTAAIGLCAQTGLFGISFGQSRADVQSNLTKAGFTVEESKDTQIRYTNPKIENLTELAVEFSFEGGVKSWEIYYSTIDKPGVLDDVMKQLSDLHGSEPWWDDYFEEWIWDLENDMAVYMYEGEDYIRVDYDVWDDSFDYWW
ncbi:MAG TPA: hypothetical protein PLO35_06465 [Candidatus Cloacimonadota bacterium]|nr:hypothetical protein [Candidatus Cloacimonadota bacterium]